MARIQCTRPAGAGTASARRRSSTPREDYEEISLDDEPAFRSRLFELTGGWTVPQILIDGMPIGGYTELWRLDHSGALDQELAA